MFSIVRRGIGRARWQFFVSRQEWEIIIHDSSRVLNEPLLAMPDIAPTDLDRHIAARLLKAFRMANEAERAVIGPTNDIWADVRTIQHSYLDILINGTADQLAFYLCNMYRTDATHGTMQGQHAHRRLTLSGSYNRFMAVWMKDRIASFAEEVGAVPVENPEQGQAGWLLSVPAADLLEMIELKIGRSLHTPQIDGGLYKLVSGGRVIHKRDVYGQSIAHTLHSNGDARKICEIGGGIGRLAYWSMKFGTEKYSIIDLPHMNVLQSYYLARTMPERCFQFFGETANSTAEVIIAPYFAREMVDDIYDVVVNVDSFPEIDATAVLDYLNWIKKTTKQMLSINQECQVPSGGGQAQNNVPDLVTGVGGFTRRSRAPFWLRKGYVTEWYDIGKPQPI
ncbi:putative sugar O-methyltransferase [Polymorphobacter sp. PAMC 29334]|uniref:putative sugar O-methyltransferase n=1 Tax=Polymorphobacter sp. PAMC 29334 TaxID=2862331 RepID=UPI001C783C71|nr:putative sugar O-methyltransferase [Polymorphobacter sp. PAMC 29334]QYE35956.1 putative sugar O-methyltransferase [Polymorphobacter sp. PAMC 29334]